ncbi:MAG: hypothetical protein LBC85_03540 [Fibromonadaceae bacterium]|jgi:hypothetical protein|nr:hypothetical protein [Fibromonadaceae bacterium]
MKLAQNFNYSEFTKTLWDKLDQRTQIMLQAMANLLQVIRTEIGKPIVISSGARSLADYKRLQSQGLNPSPTSDHFYGAKVPCQPGSAAFKKYGATYNLAVGAADMVCPSMDTVEFYNFIAKMRYAGKIKTGQLLLEKNNTMWVHIANFMDPFLSPAEKKLRGDWSLSGMGYSLNNGKTWTKLDQAKKELLPKNLK